jgi:hypothetical protein
LKRIALDGVNSIGCYVQWTIFCTGVAGIAVFTFSQRAIVSFWDKAQMSPLEISPPIAIVATVSIAGKSAY